MTTETYKPLIAARKTWKLRAKLPALSERMECIVEECGKGGPDASFKDDPLLWSLYGLIAHLNDYHEWPRHDVADWLDTLALDLTFPTPDEGGDVDEHAGDTN